MSASTQAGATHSSRTWGASRAPSSRTGRTFAGGDGRSSRSGSRQGCTGGSGRTIRRSDHSGDPIRSGKLRGRGATRLHCPLGGVGFDAIDIPSANGAGVLVALTPDAIARAVAEAQIALVLALAKRVPDLDRRTRAGSGAPICRFWAPTSSARRLRPSAADGSAPKCSPWRADWVSGDVWHTIRTARRIEQARSASSLSISRRSWPRATSLRSTRC